MGRVQRTDSVQAPGIETLAPLGCVDVLPVGQPAMTRRGATAEDPVNGLPRMTAVAPGRQNGYATPSSPDSVTMLGLSKICVKPAGSMLLVGVDD